MGCESGLQARRMATWSRHPDRVIADHDTTEVLAHLVVASVFKTVGSYVNRAVGGFDSHALPPFFLDAFGAVGLSAAQPTRHNQEAQLDTNSITPTSVGGHSSQRIKAPGTRFANFGLGVRRDSAS